MEKKKSFKKKIKYKEDKEEKTLKIMEKSQGEKVKKKKKKNPQKEIILENTGKKKMF